MLMTMTTTARKRTRIDSQSGYHMTVERDHGFYWAEEEEEEDMDADMNSPTDVSEDSVDVKVKPVANLRGGYKRRRPNDRANCDSEIKKRSIDFRTLPEIECSPFRPWSETAVSGYIPQDYSLPGGDQDEPLSLVLRDKREHSGEPAPSTPLCAEPRPRPQEVVRLRGPHGDFVKDGLEGVGYPEPKDSTDVPRAFSVESLIYRPGTSSSLQSTATEKEKDALVLQPQQRNYKNMTRERRIEANARERTRVHTISAAFDTLRRAVPAYSHNQKLSKLSVLRIACSYILTLSRVAGLDYSGDQSQPDLQECVDHVSRTIQLEGKLRKKKED